MRMKIKLIMYSVADALLCWDEISLQRDLFKKATYAIVSTMCGGLE